MDKLRMDDGAIVRIINRGSVKDFMEARGMFRFKLINPDGSVEREDVAFNLVTIQGKNDALDKYLAGAAYTATFNFGLISSVGYTALVNTDTAAQINGTNGWREAGPTYAPNYSEAVRQTASWGAAASAGVKTNSTVSSFTISGNGTIKGMFMSTSSVKNGVAGILVSEALFSGGDQVVVIGQIAQVSYSLQL